MTLRLARCAVVALAALLAPAAALAQAYPMKPVRLVVPFPPGGATNVIARLVAQKMQEVWGQPVLVENRPGAGTVVGTDHVAKSAPDGHTIAMVITAHVINPSLRSSMPYDTLKDLSGVTQVALQHLVIAAHPAFEAGSIAELIAYARKNPGKVSYATPGSGTALHLAGEMLNTMAGISMLHVPYKGGAPAQADVMGGRVPLLFDVLHSTLPQVKGGKLKMLALLSPQRAPSAPEFPVVAETVAGLSAMSIIGLVVPSATPRDLVRRIGGDIAKAVRYSELTARLAELGMEPVGSTPEEFDALVRSEIERWSKVVKASGAKAD